MTDTPFNRDEISILTNRLQDHMRAEHGVDLGQFEVETLLQFIERDIGGAYYNKGLHDARAAISARMDDIGEVIYQLERPSAFDATG